MHKTIIADTSCLIVLDKIDELQLLHKLYQTVVLTAEIAEEYGGLLPPWFHIVEVKNTSNQRLLELQIDKGESSAIALSLEISNGLPILDDAKARRIASRLNLDYTGTLGVIISAKRKGHISSIKPILAKLRATNFRLTRKLEERALKLAQE